MADPRLNRQLAKPVHIQRLERSLRLEPFLEQVQSVLQRSMDEDSDSDVLRGSHLMTAESNHYVHGLPVPKSDHVATKSHLYNFDDVGKERAWLKEVLLSDTSSNDSETGTQFEEGINEMLYLHKLRKKYQTKFYQNPKNRQFMYYSAGLLSKKDIYPDHKNSVLKDQSLKSAVREKKEKTEKPSRQRKKKTIKEQELEVEAKRAHVKMEANSSALVGDLKALNESQSRSTSSVLVKKEPVDLAESADFSFESDVDESDAMGLFRNVIETGSVAQSPSPVPSGSPTAFSPSPRASPKGKKRKERSKKEKGEKRGKSKKEKGPPSVKALIAQRRKLWLVICKKEISKASKARINNHKEELVSCKRAATGCMRFCRLRAMQSQKAMKDIVWRAKRLTREMQSYWKRYDRVEKVQRRQAEKEAEEQRKLDVEMMEARRQQRKLNFLITQTELYAHFMAKKLGNPDATAQHEQILGNLDEEANPQLAYLDDYDSQAVKQRVMNNVNTAFHAHQQQTQQFGADSAPSGAPQNVRPEHAQPEMFRGSLKTYQLKGMNWIANMYDEGINGILADEMGLGKTVQSIAFLAHIAERYGVWGPFLVISPASTLHNWQQELARFVPDFKIIPYWGSPQERKILRKFWDTRNLHTADASFHVVVTSYQLIVTDYKYFNRIKWQYMVLDEAQAIKSSSSTRWKMLLAFNCRNRLLLSGTPIQNSMAELWALLHFIMPTLFDSHEEFNEWFSKDIESHAENKTGIDEKHLSRLHMILKPFMLRRVKKDVENELSDKIEIMMYCPLTNRQRMLYQALKRKISIDDLLYSGGSSASAQTATTTLMNLVMQFRKVCNHPELFERREAKSPYYFQCEPYILPKYLYRRGLIRSAFPSCRHLLHGRFFIWAPDNIHHSIFPQESQRVDDVCVVNSFASFSRLMDFSPSDLFRCMNNGTAASLKFGRNLVSVESRLHHRYFWGHPMNPHLLIRPFDALSPASVASSSILSSFIFTSNVGTGYAHLDHELHCTPETIEHRVLRSRKAKTSLTEFPFTIRPSQIVPLVWTNLPRLIFLSTLKVSCRGAPLVCSDRSAAYWIEELAHCRTAKEKSLILRGHSDVPMLRHSIFEPSFSGGFEATRPLQGWSHVVLPDKETLICDAGKLQVLDTLLRRLKSEGHRVLIYSQMTRIIDLLEEYMCHRKWTYMRLDGSSKISDRRDMVADFQTRSDIFVFLLSTRAGGLGINLTAADTVIFYDSDWNPTVDQQAMDRAHRLGQTKQVTVYRLICKGTIEERILQRAREKSKIQKIVISGGSFKPDTLKPTEVVSLLLDDEEIERKYRQRQAERKQQEIDREAERKRKYLGGAFAISEAKRMCLGSATPTEYTPAASPTLTEHSSLSGIRFDETSNDGSLVVDDNSTMDSAGVGRFAPLITGRQRPRPGRGTGRRGRPPGSGKRARVMASSGTGRETMKSPPDSEVGFLSPESGRTAHTSIAQVDEIPMPSQETATSSPIAKRRPGRPRLRPVGPAHQGNRTPSTGESGSMKKVRRGGPSGPRVLKPLPVPIGLMAKSGDFEGARSSASSRCDKAPITSFEDQRATK